MTTSLLDTLTFPDDLHQLSISELDTLASDIRERLLDIGQSCGGHLASNLGVVELTIVLHALFNSPTDKLIWDTSHQTYVHKMLTGRLNQMHTIRQDGGLSGFANIFESEHDTFGAGHASTSLSASLGIAQARDLQNQDYSVVSIVGDSSLPGGMCFEALNNFEHFNSPFICILNDNNMSISSPVGSLANYITKIRTSGLYDTTKATFESVIEKIPKIGVPLKRRIEKAVEHLRDLVLDTTAGVIFEEFGFKYIGPIDGHNIPVLMAALKYAKQHPKPIMVHVVTQKGKGHAPAEEDPVGYHGISPKTRPETPIKKNPSFSKTLGETMIDICHQRDDVVVITPAMKSGSGLQSFADVHPTKFFDVGIAEEHAVTFSAGLVRAGIKPVLAIYSTFLQRGYDQLIHDVCIQNLPVVFALDRAGIAGQDGPTHQGVFDYSYMLPLPNMVIMAPKDVNELKGMLHWSVKQSSPISVRYPKDDPSGHNGDQDAPIDSYKAQVLYESPNTSTFDVLIIGVGSMAWPSFDAALTLSKQGLSCAVINLRFIKPLDKACLGRYIQAAKQVIVIEEGAAIAGVFHYILHSFPDSEKPLSEWHHIAIPDEFVEHGQISTLQERYQLNSNGIKNRVLSLMNVALV